MGASSSINKRCPANLPEHWQVVAIERIHKISEFLSKRELEYRRKHKKGDKQAKTMLANVKSNSRILPIAEAAICRLVDAGQIIECPEIDLIENVLVRLEAEPAQQISKQKFEAIANIMRKPKKFCGA